jgi:Family of unknown function (DUF5675)
MVFAWRIVHLTLYFVAEKYFYSHIKFSSMNLSILKNSLLAVLFGVLPMIGYAQSAKIEISRKSITDQCILGYLLVNEQVICYTLELPYVGNINGISTIPAGEYTGFIREDGSKGWRIELDNVSGRKNIQIHVGNYTSQILGCTLVGMGANVDGCTVSESQKARNALREKLGPLVNNNITVIYSSK